MSDNDELDFEALADELKDDIEPEHLVGTPDESIDGFVSDDTVVVTDEDVSEDFEVDEGEFGFRSEIEAEPGRYRVVFDRLPNGALVARRVPI